MNPRILQEALRIAAQVKDPVTAAVFSLVIAAILLVAALRGKDKAVVVPVGLVLALGILLLGALPLLARSYLTGHGIYEIRVVVLDPDGVPVNNAKVVCSPGGEQKNISGGTECDVAPHNRPANGLFSAYAYEASAFLIGNSHMYLGDDYNPVLTVHLAAEKSAKVQGQIQDDVGNSLKGAWASVVGYEDERILSGEGGGFILQAHASKGQLIKLHVERQGFVPYEGLQQAGDTSITIRLQRKPVPHLR